MVNFAARTIVGGPIRVEHRRVRRVIDFQIVHERVRRGRQRLAVENAVRARG